MASIEDFTKKILDHFGGDKERVKRLGRGCKAIGFPISENLEAISKNPEHFMLLISYSDLGILDKLADSLDKLKTK